MRMFVVRAACDPRGPGEPACQCPLLLYYVKRSFRDSFCLFSAASLPLQLRPTASLRLCLFSHLLKRHNLCSFLRILPITIQNVLKQVSIVPGIDSIVISCPFHKNSEEFLSGKCSAHFPDTAEHILAVADAVDSPDCRTLMDF